MCASHKPELRVLQLITTPMKFSGQTLFPLRIAEPMKGARTDFLTYRIEDDRIRAAAESMGFPIHVAPHRLKHPLRYIHFVSQLVRTNQYDVVHCHGNSCTLAIDLLAAKLGGARVRIAHSHNSSCKYAAAHRLLRPLFNLLYTHAMACGEEAGRWLFGRRPFTVVRNAIDTRRFTFDSEARSAVRQEFDCGSNTVLGNVAAFVPAKNHTFLLEIFAAVLKRNPDHLLVLVGDGPLRAEAEQKARELGIAERVRFLGTRTDVPRLLQMMDAMLLPSLHEGFPTVALEWQCAGLPVLMSDAITPDCAFVRGARFLPMNAESWVSAVLDLPAADRAAASRTGMEAIARAGYDLATAARVLEADYRRFAGR